MKQNKYPQEPKPADDSRPATDALNQSRLDFAPSADEVARRAYFSYVNQGSRSGHDVQHWLVAEAELLAERDLTRTHAPHHHPKNKLPDQRPGNSNL